MTITNIFRKWLVFALSAFAVLTVNAQQTLEKGCHLIRGGDFLETQVKGSVECGLSGENIVWDFSQTGESKSDTSNIEIYAMPSAFLWDDNNTLASYRISGDTLSIIREETPLYEMDYSHPVISMIYPFSYDQSFNVPFAGTGEYEGKMCLTETGTATVSADAYGTLILPAEDTLRNVLRTQTLRTSKIQIYNKHTKESTGTLDKKATIYEWYAHGFRYPILKTVTEEICKEGKALRTSNFSVWITPNSQQQLADETNEDIRRSDSIRYAMSAPIDYKVNVNGHTAHIDYSLPSDAHIGITLSDAQSIVYWRKEWNEQAGENKHVDIPLSGLYRGQYVIYITVNGNISTSKINVN